MFYVLHRINVILHIKHIISASRTEKCSLFQINKLLLGQGDYVEFKDDKSEDDDVIVKLPSNEDIVLIQSTGSSIRIYFNSVKSFKTGEFVLQFKQGFLFV